MRSPLVLVLLVACGSPSTVPEGACSVEGVTGTLPGVAISIRGDTCVFERGTGGSFVFEVVTDATIPAITTPDGGGGCGSCMARSTEPLTWVTWSIGGTSQDGASQSYCLCDTGCCAPDQEKTVQPAATTVMKTIDWSGRTWGGPSDYGAEMGDYFAPGVYAVNVTFNGFAQGTVQAALPIEVY